MSLMPENSDDLSARIETDPGGVAAGDLPTISRGLFVRALEVARSTHDPALEWAAFVEAAWQEAGKAFDAIPRQDRHHSDDSVSE